MMKLSLNSAVKLMLTIAMLLVLGACGKSKEQEVKLGQAAVKVNGDEITIHQINEELTLNKANVNVTKEEALKKAAKMLVDKQLLVQAAKKNKIDRNGNVISAIERAKTSILAQAYLESKLGQSTVPSKTEIDQFRKEHPEYFDDRKQYAFVNIILDSTTDIKTFALMEEKLKKFDDVIKWLKENNKTYTIQNAASVSEKLPLPLIKKLNSMALGDCVFINLGNQLIVSKLVAIKNVPPSEDEINNAINKMLAVQKSQSFVDNEIKKLYSEAKIEYLNPAYKPENKKDNNLGNSKKNNNELSNKKDTKNKVANETEKTISDGIKGL